MRFLQTLSEVGAENNTTIVFPMPIELLSAFLTDSAQNGTSKKRIQPGSEVSADALLREAAIK